MKALISDQNTKLTPALCEKMKDLQLSQIIKDLQLSQILDKLKDLSGFIMYIYTWGP